MKKKNNRFTTYNEDNFSFRSQAACDLRRIYMPLCGPRSSSLKSSITPFLGGDIKIDKERFLTKPASREDLREPLRDFFIRAGKKVYALSQPVPQGKASIEAGPFWHQLNKTFPGSGLTVKAVSFIPSSDEHLELMKVTVTNFSKKNVKIQPFASIPIFGRALSNKHDHEHVTSLLHRIDQVKDGVIVEHVMAFDEEGHRENDAVYYVFGATQDAKAPVGSFPTRDSFLGESGTLERPRAVYDNVKPRRLSPTERNGKEAMGVLRFKDVTLRPGRSASFIVAMGITSLSKDPKKTFRHFNSVKKFDDTLKKTQYYWRHKSE